MFKLIASVARERTLEKVRPYLQPGEQAQEAVAGSSRILPSFAVAVCFIVLVFLEYPSSSSLHARPWVFFAWAGLAFLLAATARRVVLVATDRRIVLFRASTFLLVPRGALLEGPRTEVTVTWRSASILVSAFPVEVETTKGAAEKLYVPQWLRASVSRIALVARTPPPPPVSVPPT
jgi:hypothetical protein